MADTPVQQNLTQEDVRDFYAKLRKAQNESAANMRTTFNTNGNPFTQRVDRYGNQTLKLPDEKAQANFVKNYNPNEISPYRQWTSFKAETRPEAGGKFKRTGFGALAGMRDQYGRPVYAGSNQRARLLAERGPSADVRDSFPGSIARNVANSATDKSEEGSLLDTIASSSAGSTLAGAGIGAGTAALAAYVADRLGVDILSPTTAAMIGAGLGSATGWKVNRVYTGEDALPTMNLDWAQPYIEKAKQQALGASGIPGLAKSGSVKQAAMYQDPRNFILEKLQRDNELSMADKATLAGKIRNMSLGEASQLETLVRGALGIGVGAIIARFFGLGLLGTLAGAGLGAWASTRFSERKPQFGSIFDNGGTGFSTYNEFLGATYF